MEAYLTAVATSIAELTEARAVDWTAGAAADSAQRVATAVTAALVIIAVEAVVAGFAPIASHTLNIGLAGALTSRAVADLRTSMGSLGAGRMAAAW